MNIRQLLLIYMVFMKKIMKPDLSSFLSYIDDEKLRRMIVDIEMMSLNGEITDQELMDYINQVLKHQKMLKIKKKEAN